MKDTMNQSGIARVAAAAAIFVSAGERR